MIVRPTIAGERVRIRFSNACGSQPLPIGAAHIALVSKDDKIIAESDRTLTFAGKGSISYPAGRSDVKRSCRFEVSGFCGDCGQYFPSRQSR